MARKAIFVLIQKTQSTESGCQPEIVSEKVECLIVPIHKGQYGYASSIINQCHPPQKRGIECPGSLLETGLALHYIDSI